MKKGWEVRKVGDVCAFEKMQGIHDHLPYVGLESIESHTARFLGTKDVQTVKSSTFRFSPEHVLYGRLRPYLNKVLAPDFEGHCSTEIFPIKPFKGLSRDYLRFWLLSPDTCAKIEGTCTGARMPRANMEAVLEFEFPLPPLPEQRRIVGILDEAFDAIATAKANTEKNLQNARAIFESHMEDVLNRRGDGWFDHCLGDLAVSISTGPFGTMLHKSDYVPEGIPLVNPMNIVESRIVPSGKMMVTPETRARLSPYILEIGDIVIARRGELGRCAIVSEKENGWLCGTGSFFVRLSTKVTRQWFVFLFGSNLYKARLTENSVGTTMNNLNQGILQELVIPVPPLEDQRRLVDEFCELQDELGSLRDRYNRKIVELQRLKTSLLDQAFRGNL